jgi:hypothetical protein
MRTSSHTKIGYVLKISYHISFQDSVISRINIAATSKVPASYMLILPLVGN